MPSTATARHLRRASGYLGLGMLNDASDELEAIEGEDRLSAEVMAVRADLYMQAKQWDLLIAVSHQLNRIAPDYMKAWIFRAHALRKLDRIAEAKDVLLAAEPMHGEKCGRLHYNMACYHSLLGELENAKARLRRACQMDKEFNATALDDPDLKALWASWDPAQLSCE